MPLATREAPGAFYRDWRLVAIDGTTLDLPDTPANENEFGRPGASRGASAFPQARLVAFAECGTHAITGAVIGPYGDSEQTLTRRLLDHLGPGMLCLADRGFAGHPLFAAAAATGADLVWRARSNAKLPVLERYDDGSFLSEIVATDDKRTRANVTPVRVIEYTVDDPGR
ncbi:MAG: IS4 family transposase, partial [Pseudonocardiaceae bacterium]|nr:IS4 family transposase [Pseudonocardiaceae bacterium]